MAQPFQQFLDGVWEWEDNHLIFRSVRRTSKINLPLTFSRKSSLFHTGTHGDTSFNDSSSPHLQNQFYYKFRRKKLINGPDVVTMQDIKNVVFFLSVGLTEPMFIRLFNSEKINPFLRSLVLYFDLFLKVWVDLVNRNSLQDCKLRHHTAEERENKTKVALSELRCKVGQHYAAIIMGENEFENCHYTKRSPESDKILFVSFSNYCTRFVWIALSRTYFFQIQNEMERLFLSESFYNMKEKMKNKKDSNLETNDLNIIYGKDSNFIGNICERSSMYQTSPPIFDVINKAQNFMNTSFQLINKDQMFGLKSIDFINAALFIPEELLDTVGIDLGLIGKPRTNFEYLLQIKVIEVKEEKELDHSIGLRKSRSVHQSFHAQELFTMLNKIHCEITFPQTVEVMGGSQYSFSEAVNVLTTVHNNDAKQAQKNWIEEFWRLVEINNM